MQRKHHVSNNEPHQIPRQKSEPHGQEVHTQRGRAELAGDHSLKDRRAEHGADPRQVHPTSKPEERSSDLPVEDDPWAIGGNDVRDQRLSRRASDDAHSHTPYAQRRRKRDRNERENDRSSQADGRLRPKAKGAGEVDDPDALQRIDHLGRCDDPNQGRRARLAEELGDQGRTSNDDANHYARTHQLDGPRRVTAARVDTRPLKECLTQAELGDACGLHLSHISQIEKQHRLPSVPTLVTIATALGVSTDYLLGLTDA